MRISHAFILPYILNQTLKVLRSGSVVHETASIQKDIDDAAFTLYGIGPVDRVAIRAFNCQISSKSESDANGGHEDNDDTNEAEAPVGYGADSLNSWFVGVAFGRFDLRLATGERGLPQEPDPFDPLPSRSPGMWPEEDEAAHGARCPR